MFKFNIKNKLFEFLKVSSWLLVAFLLAWPLALAEKNVIKKPEVLVDSRLSLNVLTVKYKDNNNNIKSSKLLNPNLILVKSVIVKSPQLNGRHGYYEALINKKAAKYNVSPAMVKAIIQAESNYNAKIVSPNGAIGLMQVMPHTGRAMGVGDLSVPEENIDAGVKYFKNMLNTFNDNEVLALAAYNSGPDNVRKYGNRVPPFKETEKFVNKVMVYYKFNLLS